MEIRLSALLATTRLFDRPAFERRTPVQLPFARREELTTTVRWPEGWSVESAPQDVTFSGSVGALDVRIERGTAGQLVHQRLFEIAGTEVTGSAGYTDLHNLYKLTSGADAQPLVLTRE